MYIYEYTDRHGVGVITDWMRRRLQRVQRVRLASKIDLLSRIDAGLQASFVKGPIGGHIYKLKVLAGRVQLRPMLCKGPIDNANEWTLLFPAIERGDQLEPADAVEKAEARRQEIIADRRRRKVYEEPD